MTWLHEHGLVSCYDDYVSLPAQVLYDARMLMVREAQGRERQQQRSARRGSR